MLRYAFTCTTVFFSDIRMPHAEVRIATTFFLGLRLRHMLILTELCYVLQDQSDVDLEAVLDKVMTIFRFLQEKDVFEKYYKQHLAKRLLSGRSYSDDAERSLLVKLKTECGYQFTSKLESMFNDIKTSEDMMRDFKHSLEEGSVDLGMDFSVQV